VLFFFLFKKFISKPFAKFLDVEKQKEKDKEKILEAVKKQEEIMVAKEDEWRKRMKKENEDILKKATVSAHAVREEMIVKATKDASVIIEKAKKQLEEEHSKLNQEAADKVAKLSLLIVQKSLKDYLDEESEKKVTAYILKNLKKDVSEL
jgi:F-type H+-transporting ATPase subunit b